MSELGDLRPQHAKDGTPEAQGACLEGGAEEGEHVGKVERHLQLSGLVVKSRVHQFPC